MTGLNHDASDEEILDYLRLTVVSPAVKLLGCAPLAVDAAMQSCKVRFDTPAALANAAGFVQGGQLCAMLDLVTSLAAVASRRFMVRIATLELKTSFIRPAQLGVIFGKARVLNQGKSIVFLEGELTDPDGQLIAAASATAKLTPIPVVRSDPAS